MKKNGMKKPGGKMEYVGPKMKEGKMGAGKMKAGKSKKKGCSCGG